MGDPAGPVASFKGVSFWYPGAAPDHPALKSLDLSLQAGSIILLCGPSGSGKSTLLRLFLGLVPQLSGGSLAGEIQVLGRDPSTVPPRQMAAAGVGLLFQNPVEGFVAERVLDEVAFGPENLGLPGHEVEARAGEALRAVGLEGFQERRLRTLSAGQQQRVALAGALALRPRLLLLDEPTAHLDERTARAILDLAARAVRERGATLLLGEHRLSLAAPLADQALVISKGSVVAMGPPHQALADPSLAALGVPVPRAAQLAHHLGLNAPISLTPVQLAQNIGLRTGFGEGSRSEQTDLAEASPPLAAAPEKLSFECVSYTYPGTSGEALRDVTFSLQEGELAVVMGPSGAGKSTLTRLALGLLLPTAGHVALCGLPTGQTPFRVLAEHGGLVLQNPLLQLLAATVRDELLLGLRRLAKDEAQERVSELLRIFDLTDVQERHPLALSEGQRRRVALAATLARQPRLLVLDEPTLGQDERQRLALQELLRALMHRGAAVLCVTHDAEFANDVAGRVLLLEKGHLIANASFDDVIRREIAGPEPLGIPLGDVPATGAALRDLGRAVPFVRTEADLIQALR